MKKLAFLSVLLLSTSLAMAQFGKLENLAEGNDNKTTNVSDNNNNNNNNNEATPTPGTSSGLLGRAPMIERAIVDGLVLIKQDFQLEDTIEGNRYNWQGGKEFGGSISFMVRTADGIITTDEIVAPWNYDDNYPQFKGRQYKPVYLRTSLMTVNQKGWKVQEDVMEFEKKGQLANGLKIVTTDESDDDGFIHSKGYGKKEAWVIWLMVPDGNLSSIDNCAFRSNQLTMNIEKGKKLYDIEAPKGAMSPIGGIVVEPVFDGIGHIDVALIGVVSKTDDKYQMAISLIDDDDSDDDEPGNSSLTEDDDDD